MKLKTHKATSKRFKLTKNGKLIKRTAGQGHFNSRESGKITINKRRNKLVTNKKDSKTIKTLLIK
jgi:large subunit ribosomal protein L35